MSEEVKDWRALVREFEEENEKYRQRRKKSHKPHRRRNSRKKTYTPPSIQFDMSAIMKLEQRRRQYGIRPRICI